LAQLDFLALTDKHQRDSCAHWVVAAWLSFSTRAIRLNLRRCDETRSDAIFLRAVTLARNSRNVRVFAGDFEFIVGVSEVLCDYLFKQPNHYMNGS
jgi:hypothetical protein